MAAQRDLLNTGQGSEDRVGNRIRVRIEKEGNLMNDKQKATKSARRCGVK